MSDSNKATFEEIITLELRVAELESTFRHYHVNNGTDGDVCRQCGLDLRDPIHTRMTP